MIMLFSVLPMIYTGQIERFTDKVRWPYKISQNPNHILRKVTANIFISRTEQIRKVFKYKKLYLQQLQQKKPETIFIYKLCFVAEYLWQDHLFVHQGLDRFRFYACPMQKHLHFVVLSLQRREKCVACLVKTKKSNLLACILATHVLPVGLHLGD